MKHCVVLLVLMLLTSSAHAQFDADAEGKKILEEGLYLFRLEKASWHASDLLSGRNADLMNNMDGYLSYPEAKRTKTIFWDKNKQIIFTVSFDSIASASNGKASLERRNPTALESDLISLRTATFTSMIENKDRFFSFYNDTSPNIIPFIRDGLRMVYVLTGSTQNELLIGNDYVLTLNEKNDIVAKQVLHKSLIRMDMSPNNTIGSTHTHVLKDQPLITATDVCTFMLYRDVLKIKSHVVISEKYMCIFNADHATLIIRPTE